MTVRKLTLEIVAEDFTCDSKFGPICPHLRSALALSSVYKCQVFGQTLKRDSSGELLRLPQCVEAEYK